VLQERGGGAVNGALKALYNKSEQVQNNLCLV